MNNENIKKATANILLDIGAISTDGAPYILSSGVKSPVYVDIRKIVSYPSDRYHIFNYMVQYINNNIGHYNFDVIAGGESAGIPFASIVANRFNVPLIYVRKEPKKYGGGNQIEGTNYVGKRVLLIEDLMSFGSSKAVFVDALRKAGAIVEHILVVFDYGIAVDLPGISIHSLTNFIALLEESQNRNYWDKDTTDKIHQFLQKACSYPSATTNINSFLPKFEE